MILQSVLCFATGETWMMTYHHDVIRAAYLYACTISIALWCETRNRYATMQWLLAALFDVIMALEHRFPFKTELEDMKPTLQKIVLGDLLKKGLNCLTSKSLSQLRQVIRCGLIESYSFFIKTWITHWKLLEEMMFIEFWQKTSFFCWGHPWPSFKLCVK